MARLLCDGRDVARLQVASTARQRTRGLLGRSELDGAMLLTPARSVHTLGMQFAIDVAHLDSDFVVLAVATMRKNRVSRVVWGARQILEAPAGALTAWGVTVGSRLQAVEERAA